MEEKLDELISLVKVQNKAWEHCLNMLNDVLVIMSDKYQAQEKLLEKHPAVKGPVEKNDEELSERTQTLNSWSDDAPYGVDVEESIPPNTRSFPAAENIRPVAPQAEGITENTAANLSSVESPSEYGGATSDNLEHFSEEEDGEDDPVENTPSVPSVQGPPVTSKAELLERQGS